MEEERVPDRTTDEILLENECLIRRILEEGNHRKNKNFINYSMTSLINQLERNIISICREQPPGVMADPKVIQTQLAGFQKMCKRRLTAPTTPSLPEPK